MEWLNTFHRHAANEEEVDLINFNRDYDIEIDSQQPMRNESLRSERLTTIGVRVDLQSSC